MTTQTLNDLFNECFFIIPALPEKERIEYHLICRYYDKVSDRLKKRKIELYEYGASKSNEYILNLLNQKSKLMDLVEKQPNNWQDKPIVLGLEYGIKFSDS